MRKWYGFFTFRHGPRSERSAVECRAIGPSSFYGVRAFKTGWPYNAHTFSHLNEKKSYSGNDGKAFCSGFSFVELSMVLAVIGLLVGAIMVGQQVLDAARLKAVVSEVQTLKTATGQFQTLYNGFPGDIADATDYWSGATNGDANGEIAPEPSNEAFQALSQMALAGFLNGSYTGTWGSAFDIGNNVMKSKLERGGMLYVRCCGTNTNDDSTLGFLNNVTVFSGANSNTQRGGVVTPEEAKSIDLKSDDGSPDSGSIGAIGAYDTNGYKKTNCYTGSGTGAAYDLTNTDTGCQMLFGYNWE